MSGVKGSFDGLRRLRTKAASVKDPSFMLGMSQALAAEGQELVDDGFATSTDPSGRKWKPLKLRQGQPLRDTGRLQRSFTTQVTNRGFVIGTNVRYAVTHQEGRVIKPVRAKALRFKVRGGGWHTQGKSTVPARPFFPKGGRLSAKWDRALKEAAREYVNERVSL